MAGISNQEWRQRALDKQRDDEARVGVLQKFLSQTRALGDANAKCVLAQTSRAPASEANPSRGPLPRRPALTRPLRPHPHRRAPPAGRTATRSGGSASSASRLRTRRRSRP
jgi:hypothetical protein